MDDVAVVIFTGRKGGPGMDYELFIGTPQNNIRFDIYAINGGCYHWDGCDFEAALEIHSSFIDVSFCRYFAYVDGLLNFYDQLKTCYETLQGKAQYHPIYEADLVFELEMLPRGYVKVTGELHDNDMHDGNYVHFEFSMDQSYLKETVNQLKRIVDRINLQFQNNKIEFLDDDEEED